MIDNSNTVLLNLYKHIPERTLVDVTQIVLDTEYQSLFALKIKPLITPDFTTIIQENNIKLPLLQLHYLYSVGILFGFVFATNYKAKCHDNYISVVQNKVSRFNDVKVKLQNEHFTIFDTADGASLVALNHHFTRLNPDILKGSSAI